jgi:hypothetical protein
MRGMALGIGKCIANGNTSGWAVHVGMNDYVQESVYHTYLDHDATLEYNAYMTLHVPPSLCLSPPLDAVKASENGV